MPPSRARAILGLLLVGAYGAAYEHPAWLDPTTRELVDTLALGDSVFSSLSVQGEVDTFYVDLQLGDTVDVGLWPIGAPGVALQNPQLRFFDPAGVEFLDGTLTWFPDDSTRWGTRRAHPHRVVTTAGLHRIEVGGFGFWTGDYLLNVRRSAGIPSFDAFPRMSIPEGGAPRTDTLWLLNAGAREVSWTLTSSEPFVTVSPTSGTLAAPSPSVRAAIAAGAAGRTTGPGTDAGFPEAPPDEAELELEPARPRFAPSGAPPPGAFPIEVTIDPAGFVAGEESTSFLDLRSPDEWFVTGRDAGLKVYDPSFSIVAEEFTDNPWAIEVHPDGRLVLSTSDEDGSELSFMDPVTGEVTSYLPDLSPVNAIGITGLAYAPDGVLWVTDNYGLGDHVFRIFPDGSKGRVDYSGGAREATPAPGGGIYFSAVTRIFGVSRFGVVTQIWDDATGPRATGIAYNPLDGLIYFGGRGTTGRILRSLDPGTGLVRELGDPGGSVYSISVGASGHLYLGTIGTANVVVMSTDGTVVREYYGPAVAGRTNAVLTCGAIYGTTSVRDQVYHLPIDDCPLDLSEALLLSNFVSPTTVAPGWERTVGTFVVESTTEEPAEVTAEWSAPWLTLEADSARTTARFAVTVDATGLAPGTYEDQVAFNSPDVVNSPLHRTVRIEVVAPTVTLGTDVLEAFADEDDRSHTYYVDLTEGEAVDIGVFDEPPDAPLALLVLRTPDGTALPGVQPRGSPVGELFPAFLPPETGTYEIEVRLRSTPGAYRLSTRLAGAVVTSDPRGFQLWAPLGTTDATDELWLFNSGPGSVDWQLASTLPTWLALDATSGTLAPSPGPAPPGAGPSEAGELVPLVIDPERITARPPPEGATRIELTADLSALVANETDYTELLFESPSEPWAGNHVVRVDATALDPAIEVVAALPFRPMDVLAYSADELMVTRNRDLWTIDRNTGTPTLWIENLGVDGGTYPSPVLGIEHTGDGAIYVADQVAPAIYRVEPDGTFSTAMVPGTTVYDPIVTNGGTLFAATFDGFERLNRDGSVTTVAEVPGIKRATYNPVDGWIYYVQFLGPGELYRVNPATGVVQLLGPLDASVRLDLEFGASGNLYVLRFGGYDVVSPDLVTLEEVTVPTVSGFGITLGGPGEDVLYGVSSGGGFGSNGHIYRHRVSDHRMPRGEGPHVRAWADDVVTLEERLFTVPIAADITQTERALGSFGARIRWDPTAAEFVSLSQGGFEGIFETNDEGAADGSVVLAGANADEESNTGSTVLGELVLRALAPTGSSFLLDLEIDELVGTDFADLTGGLSVQDGLVRVTHRRWGDPSNDAELTSLDALMCLMVVVGATLPEDSDGTQCDVAPDVDPDSNGVRDAFDGTVSALDALAILRFIVALELPEEYRAGRGR